MGHHVLPETDPRYVPENPDDYVPNGIVVTEPDGTKRPATDDEAAAWARQAITRGTHAPDHPAVLKALAGGAR